MNRPMIIITTATTRPVTTSMNTDGMTAANIDGMTTENTDDMITTLHTNGRNDINTTKTDPKGSSQCIDKHNKIHPYIILSLILFMYLVY